MNFNFELILFYAVIVTGIISLIDLVFFAKKRRKKYIAKIKGMANPEPMELPFLADYARSFFPVLLIVFFLRSFLFEPFRIPSGSLEPTLLIGDFIVVNKFAYGLRLPVIHTKLMGQKEPKRGDILVFRYPENPSIDYIKRVVGVPGDHIQYINKVLYVNGQVAPQTLTQKTTRINEDGNTEAVVQKEENLLGIKHAIYQIPEDEAKDFKDIIVPEGMYFAMGDNRDRSADSRYWGFVPDKNIVGKAEVVWLSWDATAKNIRWNRFGQRIH